MYKDFFGLSSSPFELSPDPFFMVSSDSSKEALASISSAIGQRKGFVVMTGEVGTGKTLILRCLFELWEREQIPFAYFIGPRLSTTDFLSYINFELGIGVTESTKGNLLRALYGFLLAQFEKGLTTVFVIDEAHQVSRSVLEEIRMLTNFETAQQKLVQIVLVGQPELDKKLDSIDLRSLKQRIAVRCKLEPLRIEEMRNYIERRLELAGASTEANTIFPVDAIKRIYHYSQGIPRLVNNICDQALITASASEVRVVPVEVIDEIASRFRLQPATNLKQRDRPSAPANSIEVFDRDKSSKPVPASDARAGKPSDPDAVLLYVDLDNGMAAQATPPAKPEILQNSSSKDDFSSYTRALGREAVDRDRLREVLTELDLQSWNPAGTESNLPPDPIAFSETNSSAGGTSGRQVLESNRESLPCDASVLLASTPTQLTVWDTQAIAGKDSSDAHREGPAAIVAVQDEAQQTAAEELKPESTQFTVEKPIGRDRPSKKYDKEILIGTLVAAFLLALASAMYLRISRGTSTTSSNVTSEQMRVQPAAPPAPPTSGTGPSKPNSDLLASKQLSEPSLHSTKSAFGHIRLAKPKIDRSTKIPAAGDSGGAPAMDGNLTANLNELSSELVDAKQSAVPPPRGAGEVTPARLISSVSPVYPALARNQHISGDVRIDALIDATGRVSDMKMLSGPLVLQDSAREAVRRWKFHPATLNDKSVPMHLTITVQFHFDK
jgi:general secretion pathway protein A